MKCYALIIHAKRRNVKVRGDLFPAPAPVVESFLERILIYRCSFKHFHKSVEIHKLY